MRWVYSLNQCLALNRSNHRCIFCVSACKSDCVLGINSLKARAWKREPGSGAVTRLPGAAWQALGRKLLPRAQGPGSRLSIPEWASRLDAPPDMRAWMPLQTWGPSRVLGAWRRCGQSTFFPRQLLQGVVSHGQPRVGVVRRWGPQLGGPGPHAPAAGELSRPQTLLLSAQTSVPLQPQTLSHCVVLDHCLNYQCPMSPLK